MNLTPQYRAFIAHWSKDIGLVQKNAELLENQNVDAIWDKAFQVATGFHEEIKLSIAHCHVFIPLLTDKSKDSPWVHQEIGFAIALNVPIMPVSAGVLPGKGDEMPGCIAGAGHYRERPYPNH